MEAHEIYRVCVPEFDLTDEMLDKMMHGHASCRHIIDTEAGERAAYHLSDWQRALFNEAKQTDILINPTKYHPYLDDALHNVWKAYQGMRGQCAVEVRLEPALTSHQGGLGWLWQTSYTVGWTIPMNREVSQEGVDELRFFMTVSTADDPLGEWAPGKSHVDHWGHGALVHVSAQEALPLARNVLAILQGFSREILRREGDLLIPIGR